MKRIFATLWAFGYLLFAGLAAASPLSYINAPLDTVQAAANAVIAAINASSFPQATLATCSGTTAATCPSLRFTVSVTGLTTAAGGTSANMVVTDTGNVTTSSQVMCQVGNYTGTGIPSVAFVAPTANTVTFAIQNYSSTASLSATVPVFCQVSN